MKLTQQERALIIIALTEKSAEAWNEAGKHRDTDTALADIWAGEAARIEAVADKFRIGRVAPQPNDEAAVPGLRALFDF
jgi:hypothetical protein